MEKQESLVLRSCTDYSEAQESAGLKTLCNFPHLSIILLFSLLEKEEERTEMEKRQLTDLQSLRRTLLFPLFSRDSHLPEHRGKILAARACSGFPAHGSAELR